MEKLQQTMDLLGIAPSEHFEKCYITEIVYTNFVEITEFDRFTLFDGKIVVFIKKQEDWLFDEDEDDDPVTVTDHITGGIIGTHPSKEWFCETMTKMGYEKYLSVIRPFAEVNITPAYERKTI
jgi:hypothetical protein